MWDFVYIGNFPTVVVGCFLLEKFPSYVVGCLPLENFPIFECVTVKSASLGFSILRPLPYPQTHP